MFLGKEFVFRPNKKKLVKRFEILRKFLVSLNRALKLISKLKNFNKNINFQNMTGKGKKR